MDAQSQWTGSTPSAWSASAITWSATTSVRARSRAARSASPGTATLAYFKSFGMMDLERGKPTADDTIYRIYSMTKPIASVALMDPL